MSTKKNTSETIENDIPLPENEALDLEGSTPTEPTVEEQLQAQKDQNLRLYAEFENFRKRNARERLELISSANENTLKALIPVLDDFERALKNVSSDSEAYTGVHLIYAKLADSLKLQGLKAMESSQGLPFDAETMEAITTIPAPTPDLAGRVIDEIEKGYRIGEKIIRYAKVVVGQV